MKNSVYIPTKKIAEDIAKRYGTPIFITDGAAVVNRIKSLKKAFPKQTKIYYALKANNNPSILKLMLKNGINGIDATSHCEIKFAKKIGFSAKQIILTGNSLSSDELRAAHEEHTLLNIGSLSELKRFAELFPGTDISLRINPGSGEGEFKGLITAGKKVKFGLKKTELTAANDIIEQNGLNVIGLHFHLGSGLYDTKNFTPAVKFICGLGENYKNLQFIDFGGGFGVRYLPNEKPVNLADFSKIISRQIARLEKKLRRNIGIRIEPGKFLIAESTCLLASITTVRKEKNLLTVGLNTSLNHIIRPSLYGAYHHMINISKPKAPLAKTNVVGNICESTDVLGTNIMLGTPEEGDLIAILTAGAYCASMSSLYNLRPYAAEALVLGSGTKLIKKTLGCDEIFASLGFIDLKN